MESKDREMEQYMTGLHKDVTNFVNRKKNEKNAQNQDIAKYVKDMDFMKEQI